MARVSIIIPAHNEASVIRRCLASVTEGARRGELEVLVVANGCTDDTAAIAREFGAGVIETEVASKSHALNLGDRVATSPNRVYLDADVVITLAAVRQLVAALNGGKVLACTPTPANVYSPNASWGVRAFYRFWFELAYVQQGIMGAGVYALNSKGRRRIKAFPDVIADDGYVRLMFAPHERQRVEDARSQVRVPTTLRDLVRIKTRSRLGELELRRRFPDLCGRDKQAKRRARTILAKLAARPSLALAAIPYVYVNLVTRLRAQIQLKSRASYVWARDNSSRASIAAKET